MPTSPTGYRPRRACWLAYLCAVRRARLSPLELLAFFSPTTFCHAQSFEIGQTAARNQTPAGIGLDLHVRPIQEPAVLRRIALDDEGRGRREDLRLRLRGTSPRSVTRCVGTMAARVPPARLESLLSLRLRALSGQSIDANSQQKHRAHKRVALEKCAVDPSQIEFLGLVFVKKRGDDERHSRIIK